MTISLSYILCLPASDAEVYVQEHEYLGYFDSGSTYTVIGNIKNQSNSAVIPTVTIIVDVGTSTYSRTFEHIPVAPGGEAPFKIKFPEIRGGIPVVHDAIITYVMTDHSPIPVQVLYDDTLVTHSDGHLTGRIQNTGQETVYFPTIHAIVHGRDYVLDVVQNIEFIEKIEPGEIISFSMYPDSTVTDDVSYYSCFAPVDTTVIPVTVKKNGGQFDFRYDSGAWFSAAEFDEAGTSMTMRGYNSYPLETYANFEFPPISGTEKFYVTVDDLPIDFIQSVDEMGFWHVAFSVGPTSQNVLKITGFESGLPANPFMIPQWIKTNAGWWSTGQIPDSEFLEDLNFLLEKGIIMPQNRIVSEQDWKIPPWVKIIAGYWYEDKISDEEFVTAITHLIDNRIIPV